MVIIKRIYKYMESDKKYSYFLKIFKKILANENILWYH